MKLFNKRSLGQRKRRANETLTKFLVDVFVKLLGLSLKILFYPITLTYYAFIKKEVSKNWRIFYRVLFLLMIILLVYIYFSIDN